MTSYRMYTHIKFGKSPGHICKACGVEIEQGEEYGALVGDDASSFLQHADCHTQWLQDQEAAGCAVSVKTINLDFPKELEFMEMGISRRKSARRAGRARISRQR